jgi:hypothetical protein
MIPNHGAIVGIKWGGLLRIHVTIYLVIHLLLFEPHSVPDTVCTENTSLHKTDIAFMEGPD